MSVLPSVAEPEEPKHGRILGLAEGQPRYRLLIVEDQPENRLLLRRLLEPLGFELREAANGQEAVALFEQWHPDLIWMDIRMPVMDGLEAVRRIRATKAGAETKIIALTAHALEEERSPIMAAGCDDLVRKPFREQEIFDALARHLRLKFIYEKAPRAGKHAGGAGACPASGAVGRAACGTAAGFASGRHRTGHGSHAGPHRAGHRAGCFAGSGLEHAGHTA